MNEEFMDFEEKFHYIKCALPFWFKTELNKFYEVLREFDYEKITQEQCIDLFYTLFALQRTDIWFSFLEKVFDKLDDKNVIEMLKLSSFHTTIEFEKIKKLYDKLLNRHNSIVDKKNIIFSLSFFNELFFKPSLTGHIKNFKSLPKQTFEYLTNLALTYIDDDERLITIFERIVNFRDFTEFEKERLLKIIDTEEYRGRIIDILLKINDFKFFSKAFELIHEPDATIYNKKEAVHYFSISNVFCKMVEIYFKMESIIVGEVIYNFTQYLKKINTNTDVIKHLLNLIISSNYVDKTGLSLQNAFIYIWNNSTDQHKLILLNLFSTYHNICCSGFLINMLVEYGALNDQEIVYFDESFEIKEKNIMELKKKYPVDDDFWLDEKSILNELNKMNIKND